MCPAYCTLTSSKFFKMLRIYFQKCPHSVFWSSLSLTQMKTITAKSPHVHISFQEDAKLNPAFLIELATPTSVLVREMASGLVHIALECEKKTDKRVRGAGGAAVEDLLQR
ncbi:hypothetical protein SLA2020_335690 [Shorea laevis]